MNWKDGFPKENIYFETENGILYKGDCIEIMKQFPKESIDLVVTDPPYGTTACKWDSIIPFDNMWKNINNLIKEGCPLILFGQEPFSSILRMSNIKNYKYEWYYKKRIASNFASAKYQPMKHIENIMVFSKKGKKIMKYFPIMQPRSESGKNRIKAGFKYNSQKGGDFIGGIQRNNTETNYNQDLKYPENIQEFNNRAKGDRGLHPTQKPVKLLEYLIKTYTNKGDLVLDFTCGSGTTLVACNNLNRKWIGIEISEKYCEITKQRILNETIRTKFNF